MNVWMKIFHAPGTEFILTLLPRVFVKWAPLDGPFNALYEQCQVAGQFCA